MHDGTLPPPAAVSEPASAIAIRGLKVGFADIDSLEAERIGPRARVRLLRMRIPQEGLLRFLSAAISNGPISELEIHTTGASGLTLNARAFGWPSRSELTLSAAGGRAILGIRTFRLGWLAMSPQLLRDQILAFSEAAVIRSGDVRAHGDAGLSFAPSYLFSHVATRLPNELAQKGFPPQIDVKLTRIFLRGASVHVEGGQ